MTYGIRPRSSSRAFPISFEEGVTEVGPNEIERYIENGGVYVVLHAGSAVHPDWFAAPGREKFHRLRRNIPG